jgi:hypothetical protein
VFKLLERRAVATVNQLRYNISGMMDYGILVCDDLWSCVWLPKHLRNASSQVSGHECVLPPATLHGVATEKTTILTLTAVKSQNHNPGIMFVRAVAQVVSRRLLTAKDRIRARVNPCGICGGESGTRTGFSPISSGFPCQYIIPPSLSKLISSGECLIC